MSVQVENLEKNMAKLTVTVSADKFEKAMQEAYQKQKSRINIPGFRKGKVPRAMIEKAYGPEVFYDDAANIVINEEYPQAMEESGLDIVSRPDIEVTQIEKGSEFVFVAEVAVKPDVELGEYKGVAVTKSEVSVSDEEVTAELENIRNQQARTIEVTDRAVQEGDTVIIDFEGFVDGVAFEGGKGENHPLEIGSHAFIDNFEEQLIGKNAGDETEVQRNSATGIANQMPSPPQSIGRSKIAPIINTNVRKNEIRAEIFPFDKAENKADAKILNPENRKFHTKTI